MWQIAIYQKGQPRNYAVLNDILHEFTIEGEYKYHKKSNYQVRRYINHKNNEIELAYSIGKFGFKEPVTLIQTSPFWNNSMKYIKAYPNFRYEYDDFTNNDEAKLEFGFWIINNKNVRNGWAIEKYKKGEPILGEYINGKGKLVQLQQDYKQKFIDKVNDIVNEIESDYKKALYAQSQAQLIKKQYMRRICKKSVKVSFMDNEEYKEICNDHYEKELSAKIQTKLERIAKEKAIRLEKERLRQQQIQQEQYRRQQAYERRLEQERINQQLKAIQEKQNNQNAAQILNSMGKQLQQMNGGMIQNYQPYQYKRKNRLRYIQKSGNMYFGSDGGVIMKSGNMYFGN